MRLIDADELLQEIEECANAIDVQINLAKCNKDVAKGMLSGLALLREDILRKPTAYDVDAVVEELEKATVSGMGGVRLNKNVMEIIDIVKKGGVEWGRC